MAMGITLEIKRKRARRPLFHMRWSAISAGRPGGLITEITWKAGKLEVICCQVSFLVFYLSFGEKICTSGITVFYMLINHV